MDTLIEQSNDIKKSKTNTYRVRLISAGQGSSGFYNAEMLQRDIGTALPKGTHAYMNHMTREQREAGGVRDIEDFAGSFQSEPEWVAEEQAAYANVKFRKDIAEFIEEFKDDIGVSIEVHAGVKSEDGVVEEMGYTPLNSLAIVPRAGARGKVVELIESFRTTESNQVETPTVEKNRTKMDEKEVLAAIAGANAPILEALEALKPKTEEATTPDISVVAEAVAVSGLTKNGREAVYALVESGTAVEAAIETEKARETAIREALLAEVKTTSTGGFKGQEQEPEDFFEAFVKKDGK